MSDDENFTYLLKVLMIKEYGCSEEQADTLVKKYPDIVVHGITGGNFMLRPTIAAIEIKEKEAK